MKEPEAYRAAHAQFLARKAAAGQKFVVHEVSTSVPTRVGQNTWYVDCDCGSGAVADPEWGLACCYGCGAVFSNIAFPDTFTRRAIEAVLLARPKPMTRNWFPHESVDDLVQQNVSRGLPAAVEGR